MARHRKARVRPRFNLSNVAASLALRPRAVQRQLREAGVNFARLVADERFKCATRLLADSTLRLYVIASAVGYSDAAHFSRAFRKWAGMTPQEYRRRKRRAVSQR